MARSASAIAGENADQRPPASRTSSGDPRRKRCEPPRGFGDHVLDHARDRRRTSSCTSRGAVELRMFAGECLASMSRHQRHRREVVELEKFRAQPVVDVVGIVGDIVGDRGGLRFGAGVSPEVEVQRLRQSLRSTGGTPLLAIARRPGCRSRSVSGPLCLTSPSSVSQVRLRPSKSGIAPLQRASRPAASARCGRSRRWPRGSGRARVSPAWPNGGWPRSWASASASRKILVEAERAGERAGDLGRPRAYGSAGCGNGRPRGRRTPGSCARAGGTRSNG